MTINYIPENLSRIINDPYKQKAFSKREADLSCPCNEIGGTYTVAEANKIATEHNETNPLHIITVREISCGSLSF